MVEKEELEKEEIQNVETTENNQLQIKQQELDELTDRYKRILAEFENHKKRSQKERENVWLITRTVIKNRKVYCWNYREIPQRNS